MRRRGQMRLILQAINNDWDAPESERIAAMQFVESVLRDPEATDREVITATKCCVAAIDANDRATLKEAQRLLAMAKEMQQRVHRPITADNSPTRFIDEAGSTQTAMD